MSLFIAFDHCRHRISSSSATTPPPPPQESKRKHVIYPHSFDRANFFLPSLNFFWNASEMRDRSTDQWFGMGSECVFPVNFSFNPLSKTAQRRFMQCNAYIKWCGIGNAMQCHRFDLLCSTPSHLTVPKECANHRSEWWRNTTRRCLVAIVITLGWPLIVWAVRFKWFQFDPLYVANETVEKEMDRFTKCFIKFNENSSSLSERVHRMAGEIIITATSGPSLAFLSCNNPKITSSHLSIALSSSHRPTLHRFQL